MKYLKAEKKFGQNFLKNKMVLEKIANSVTVSSHDLIIEIGPGMGALTEYLCEKDCYYLGYEIDTRMQAYLQAYETDKIQFIYGDFLQRDLEADLQDIPYENVYVVANIPYYITSPILTKLLESSIGFQNIVLLVQKEFAERIAAKPGHKEYNALTLAIDYKYASELLFLVSRYDFVPVPNVESAVIRLSLKDNVPNVDKNLYFQFIRNAFRNKRKTLKNNLQMYDWEKINKILGELDYKESVRAEEISPSDFQLLVQEYKK